MADLVAFLRARLDEDEWLARQVLSQLGGEDGFGLDASESVQRYLAYWTPNQVLAEVEAKRRVVGRHVLSPASGDPELPFDNRDDCQYDGELWPCPDLLDVAAVYSDHPDYQEGWKP